jgi:uncharacterized protein (TIGR02680 family)
MTELLNQPDVAAHLPVAATTRWQPLRVGLVDIFHYDSQEFWFRDGRLLFRGNNGTGKSKVLALTLPFLLDGDLSPSRVEPDGDRDKKMEWNLLLGGKYEERIGYTWLEFGRVAEDGERLYLTAGCGLRAARGRGIADRWFFVTSQRIGQDLFLIGGSGSVLTRDRLGEAIGASGQVTQRAEHYRRMLDEHLFRLGAARYDALISLLIQLRQPQLSKRPDEGRLSQALTEALTPLDQALLSDIAAAFHDLEQQHDQLAGLRETGRHVQRFTGRYQRYAAVAARRQARMLRSEHSGFEQQQRELADLRNQISAAERDEHAAQTARDRAASELAGQRAAEQVLVADPGLQSLDGAERYAAEAAEQSEAAAQAAAQAGEAVLDRAGKRADAAAGAAGTRRELAGRTDGLRLVGAEAGIDSDPVLGALALPDGEYGQPEAEAAGRKLREYADSRDQAVARVAALAENVQARERDLHAAREQVSEAEAARDVAGDSLTAAQGGLGDAAARHIVQWRELARLAGTLGLPGMVVPDPDDLDLAGWTETLDGPHPAEQALREAVTAVQFALARASAATGAELAAATESLTGLQDERDQLTNGVTQRPPVPYTRSEGSRSGLDGAPIWQVTDFAPRVTEVERAGLEAALEASGLLDGWLTTDGQLLHAGTHDVIVIPGAAAELSLRELLVPAIDINDPHARAISADLVEAVLASVSSAEVPEGPFATCDGRWRLGPLHGSWAKEHASYIGHGAREEARRRRLAELAGLIAAAEERVAAAEQSIVALEAQQIALSQLQSSAPSDGDLRAAHAAVMAAATALQKARDAVDAAVAAVAPAELDLAESARDRDLAAADARCPPGLEGLRLMGAAIAGYRQVATEFVAALRLHAISLGAVRTWDGELAAAEREASVLAAAEQKAALRAEAERKRAETLRASIGASVEELKRRLAGVRARIAQLDAEQKEQDAAERAAAELRARGEGAAAKVAETLRAALQKRDDAVAELRRFAETGLLHTACESENPDTSGPWAAEPAVRLARRIEQQLSDLDDGDEAWRRIQEEISSRFSELSEGLTRYGHHASASVVDWFIVTIGYQGTERTPAVLAELLADEISYRERLLTERQRQVIEDHLINDVASHLQQLMSDAEMQVAQMNSELRDRPTSTGMVLRLRWEVRPDGPVGLAEARARLLRQDFELWSPADREAVGDFLNRQIEAARAEDETATWAELLGRALDYRHWHRFLIDRQQDGNWRSATGPASGGERVLTVSVPLFAAASAHYRSAHPHAPRLIMLDEAFAGVDDAARGQFLGLLAAFDLDVAMTSEREWGFYPSVPGIATHQLVRRDGIDAVHVTTWEWDGSQARQVQRSVLDRVPAQARKPADEAAQLPGVEGW